MAIPDNKIDDMDAFLDEIFQQALEYQSPKLFLKTKLKTPPRKKKLESRIKGGARKNSNSTLFLIYFIDRPKFFLRIKGGSNLDILKSNNKEKTSRTLGLSAERSNQEQNICYLPPVANRFKTKHTTKSIEKPKIKNIRLISAASGIHENQITNERTIYNRNSNFYDK